jgi:hypothetical protein
LFQLKVLEFIGKSLQAVGKMFRLASWVAHVVLDAVAYSNGL